MTEKYKRQKEWQTRNRDRINKRAKWRRKNDPEYRKKQNERTENWRKNNRERYLLGKKINRVGTDYGLSIDEYNKMVEKQKGACAICGGVSSFSYSKNGLCVDHNHETKKIRGLLCNNCNRTLGLLKDNVEVLKNAIKYLNKHAI